MNYRRILSKTSLKSSSTTEKSSCPSEEVSKLQSEVEFLKQTIESLKISVESRDAAIGTLAREKEKLYVELKSAQRINRNVHQQLVDERDMHSKEKDYLIEEIKRLSKNSFSVLNEFQPHPNTIQTKSDSSRSIKEELKSKDEVIYNICTKYFKIKSSKEKLQNKVEKLQNRSQQMCESVILLLHENRRNLDRILRKLSNSSSPSPSTKSYLNLLKVNTKLHCENTQLKVCLCVNDYSGEREEKALQNETSVTKCKSQTAPVKPKYKIIQREPVDLHPDPKLSNSYKLGKSNNFGSIHTKFAPYFRRKRLYSSEPNLASFPSYLHNKIVSS